MGATSPRPFSTRPDCTEHVRDLEDDCFTRMCCTEAIENGFIAANPEAMHEPCRELRQLWKTIYIADDMLSFAGVVSCRASCMSFASSPRPCDEFCSSDRGIAHGCAQTAVQCPSAVQTEALPSLTAIYDVLGSRGCSLPRSVQRSVKTTAQVRVHHH